ncbi:L,D-transpeptidase family protein [uncultured Ruminococcus sp.]|uniref:L,D-transpeptidase family protein n=1 Tax=uncultured Ruminococcus sp. TaxID=165186 RepID=UPI0029315D5C|nr:L,D-transpeptidase family protein [uncultured Ruminococcus sp.]
MRKRIIALFLTVILSVSVLAGCAAQQEPATKDSVTVKNEELYFSTQEVRESPKWVTELEATKDAEQLIVVAGVDKTTAYVTMHEKGEDGKWQQIIATPGFIGKDGLGEANINGTFTPVGTFTIDKAFGLADDPGCQMAYTKVDDNYYWSGDAREGKHFNELVNIKDVPDLDKENSEHIVEFDYAYQYVLNMGYNAECEKEKGFAFFLHCFRVNRTYTGGCVGVPENIMKFIMQHVKPGCKITIDSLEKMKGDLDA